jgi:sugar lactone lactonase YvrE
MDGTVRTFTEGFGFIRDMVFDSDGNLYIFSFVPGKEQISEGTIFKISTNGSSSKIFTTPHPFSSIAINPATGDLVGFDTVEDRFITITPELKVSTLSIDFGEDVFRTKIAFDKKGNLFVLALFSENFGIGPLKRRLFKITPHNEVTLFANLDTPSSSSTDDICIAPSGDIFVIASEPPVFKMLKMTPAGKITVFAKNLPCDPLSLATDLQGNIFFASSAGVFKIFKSK